MDQYQKENSELLNKAFEDIFIKHWRGEKKINRLGLELIISGYCNLGCKYCYVNNFGHKLFPKEIRNNKKILDNAGKVFDWIIENKFKFDRLEMFSGELFNQKIGYDIMELMLEKYSQAPDVAKGLLIMIPTNFTFILDPELEKKVQSLIDRFKIIGARMGLSASFDGLILESQNRPFKGNIDINVKNIIRNQDYYDRAFAFIAKNGCGLHPMVYSQGIELWKDNFLWFQNMMQRHGIHWTRLYLLQVRNAEWTTEQNNRLKDFIRFLFEWVDDKLNHDKEKIVDFILNGGFNIMRSTMGTSGRGLSCSIQSGPVIRLADLMLVPCHRTMYKGLEFGKFIVKDGKLTGELEAINPELFFAINSISYKAFPYCDVCGIKNSCRGGCLGSQLEVIGDPFVPIPTMCAMQHALMAGIIEGATKIGVYEMLKAKMTPYQTMEHELIKEYIGGLNNES